MASKLLDVDLDFEEKFYITQPYDSNDPENDWYKTAAGSDEAEKQSLPNTEEKASDSDDINTYIINLIQKRRKLSKHPPHANIPEFVNNPNTRQALRKEPATTDCNGLYSNNSPIILQHNLNRTYHSYPLSPRNTSFNESCTSQDKDDNDIAAAKRAIADSNGLCLENRQKINCKNNLNETYPPYQHSSTTSKPFSQNFSLPDDDSFTASDTNITNGFCGKDVLPSYNGFQLIGDSQLLRFSEKLLSCQKFVRSRRLGYCVSGQKINELEQRLSKKEYRISKQIMMLIGTNDFTYSMSLDRMCQSYRTILEILKNNGVEKIILLTVPPIPKLAQQANHWTKLKRFNEFILGLAEKSRIYVFDVAPLYISYNNTACVEYFEKVYLTDGPLEKVDLVHLNEIGFKLLKAALDVHFEKININR